MVSAFQRDETVIISLEIKDDTGTLVDPDTSITVTIRRTSETVPVQDKTDMIKDSVGKYHFDFLPTPTELTGIWEVTCITLDAGRRSIERITFRLEN